jgi:hypothetical protein
VELTAIGRACAALNVDHLAAFLLCKLAPCSRCGTAHDCRDGKEGKEKGKEEGKEKGKEGKEKGKEGKEKGKEGKEKGKKGKGKKGKGGKKY